MSSAADMAKTPLTLTDGDKTYRLSPITPAILGEVERYVEELPFDRLRVRLDKVGHHLTDETKDRLYGKAEEESDENRRLMLSDEPGDRQKSPLQSLAGVRKLFYFSLCVHHPDLTEADTDRLVTFDNLEEIQNMLDRASGFKKEDSVPGKKRARRSRGR